MKAADQTNPLIGPQLGADSEEEGLRILAKVIARKLAQSRRDKYTRVYEQGEDSSPASVTTDENIS